MKKLLSILVCVFLASCATDSESNIRVSASIEKVKQKFPNSKIYITTEGKFRFYVLDSAGLKIVKCYMLSSDDISEIIPLIEIK